MNYRSSLEGNPLQTWKINATAAKLEATPRSKRSLSLQSSLGRTEGGTIRFPTRARPVLALWTCAGRLFLPGVGTGLECGACTIASCAIYPCQEDICGSWLPHVLPEENPVGSESHVVGNFGRERGRLAGSKRPASALNETHPIRFPAAFLLGCS